MSLNVSGQRLSAIVISCQRKPTAKQFVPQPNSECIHYVGFAVRRNLSDSSGAEKAFNFPTLYVAWLARESKDLAQFIKLDLGARTERRKFITQVNRILLYRLKYGRHDKPGADSPWTIARYRNTGRSKLLPLKVTS
jgi:hypothetical protein